MKNILRFLLILSFSISYGQVTFTAIPIDKQLVGRDVVTNLGDIIVEGEVNNTGITYNAIEIKVYRDGVVQNASTQTLTFTGNLAPFNFTIPIVAELHNYSIKIYGKQGAISTLEKEVVDIVAGDVYIIQGQSNAEAAKRGGSSANGNQSNFIRVFGLGTNEEQKLSDNSEWFIGQGDGDYDTNGNTGQWGLKLARTLLDSENIPIAIFNGGEGGKPISYFSASSNYQTSTSTNYGRMYYRLNETGLKDKVRAVFWSQGEADGSGQENTSLIDYKNAFLALKNNWLLDYPSIEQVYIFQTRNGNCEGDLHLIKEAQRQVAFENSAISIMPTQNITQIDGCHFPYTDGYETFIDRIFPLVDRDIYNATALVDIDAPMIQSATLVNSTTLEVVTDATTLSIATVAEDFLLEDASQVDVTNTITNITVTGNKIIFALSANLGVNATISYLGQDGDPIGEYVTNSQGLEILCFYRFPIVPPTNVPPLLITQYYEGTGNNQWIEVKNISSDPIAGNVYKLVLYPDINTPIGSIDVNAPAPNHSISIGAMTPGQVRLYKNPLASGSAEPTDVCGFDGDDVILISTSIGANCYNDRIDIVGEVPPLGGSPITWGANKSFIKGCGTTEVPAQIFDVTNYIELTTDEVDNAIPLTNIKLGVHMSGPTTWITAWDNGISDRTRTTIISGTYTATDGSFGACDLTVTGTLNFDSGTSNYIEINKSLTNTGGTITIGDQESLYTVDSLNPTVPVLISGNIIKKETTSLLTDVNDYTYWSSPVVGANISNVFSANAPDLYSQGRLYYWDQSVSNTIPGGGSELLGEWISATGLLMEAGRGYISQGPVGGTYPMVSGATVSFEGQPNTGEINLIGDQVGGYIYPNNAVVYNDDLIPNPNNDLNLIGNPYPSAIDADLFISLPQNVSAIEGTIWFWTHQTPNNQNATGEQYSGDDYASYNLTGSIGTGSVSISGSASPTRFIGSGQGFIVQANSAVQQVTFTDAMRVRSQQNVQFFKTGDVKKYTSQEKDRIWLNIESSEGGAFSQLLIGFFDNATDGYDRLYDGIKLSAGYVNFYSKIDDSKYGIQGLGSFDIDKKIPLGFDTYIDDALVTYTISIDHLEGDLNHNDVYLVDSELNLIHDLKQSDYNFAVPGEGNYVDRFTIQFTNNTLGVENLELNNNFVVANEDTNLLIKSKTIIKQVKVYDITGRLLIDNKPNDSEFRINTRNIRKGTVLIVNSTFENGAEISKKAIKY